MHNENFIPRVILPKKYHAVVGDTLQLFYRGIVESPYPYFYNIEFVSDIGANYPRYYELTPTKRDVGTHTLTVNVRAADDTLLSTAKCEIEVVELGTSPLSTVNVLCVGDSLTSDGIWCREAYRRLCERGGAPEGHGLKNIRFIGTKRNGDVGYEGYGGWKWESYLKRPLYDNLDMFVMTEHDKTAEDMHSLWEDSGGNIWQLETVYKSKLKFTRYKGHKARMPEGCGVLRHIANAEHTSDVSYTATEHGPVNPFYNKDADCVDFSEYSKRIGAEKIDYVYTLLSWNGLGAYHLAPDAVPEHVRQAKIFIRRLHEQFPDAEVKIMGIPMPSVNGGTGASYGAGSVYSNAYGLCRQVMEMNIAYRAFAEDDEFAGYVEFVNVSGQFDCEYCMPAAEKRANVRCSTLERVGTNGVHPTESGYLQIADAVYRNMVAHVTNHK